jgi:low temperature requirement protein LtrA
MTTDTRTIAIRGIVAAIVGAAVNAGLVAATGAAGIAPDFMALTYPPVVFLSVVGALGATVVYALLQRRSRDPDRTFARVAAVVLVLSFVPDVGLLVGDPAATVLGVVVLIVMHVVVASASVAVLTGRIGSLWGFSG